MCLHNFCTYIFTYTQASTTTTTNIHMMLYTSINGMNITPFTHICKGAPLTQTHPQTPHSV